MFWSKRRSGGEEREGIVQGGGIELSGGIGPKPVRDSTVRKTSELYRMFEVGRLGARLK